MENSPLAIAATLVEPILLKNLVEKLADRRYDIGYSLEKMPIGLHAIETSSIEAHVIGYTNLSTETDFIKTSFITRFLFTCTKRKGLDYTFTWVNSLS